MIKLYHRISPITAKSGYGQASNNKLVVVGETEKNCLQKDRAATLSITTYRIMTLGIFVLSVTLSIILW